MVQLRSSLSMTRLRARGDSDADADDRGWNQLHVAARKGNLKEVRRLLNEGMDVNAPAWGPKSPGATPLHLAAQGGHVKIMDELLERGANIDARTKGACGCKFTSFFSHCLYYQCYYFIVERSSINSTFLNGIFYYFCYFVCIVFGYCS